MKEWPLLSGVEMTNDRNGWITAEVLNDGAMPSIDDVVKNGVLMSSTFTLTSNDASSNTWIDIGQASDVTFATMSTNMSQSGTVNVNMSQPGTVILSPELYQQLLGEASWNPTGDLTGDNEGLITKALQAAQEARTEKLKQDILLAMMELDPIQDRRE